MSKCKVGMTLIYEFGIRREIGLEMNEDGHSYGDGDMLVRG